jgi:Uma2 family endonuclease
VALAIIINQTKIITIWAPPEYLPGQAFKDGDLIKSGIFLNLQLTVEQIFALGR